MATGSITIVAESDRNPSVYFTGSRGSIGEGQTRESIRKAAQNAGPLAPADRLIMRRVTEYPVAGPEQVKLYVPSDAGGFSETACVGERSAQRLHLANLGDASQEIITQYRRIAR
jgi:hypothetical protein